MQLGILQNNLGFHMVYSIPHIEIEIILAVLTTE